MIASRSVNMIRNPQGTVYIVVPIAVSGMATPENEVQLIGAVIREQESRHKVPKSVLRAVLGRRMPFTLHATFRTRHGGSRLVQAMSVWLVKTRRAPSRHSRDARVEGLWSYDHGHAQTEYTPPPNILPQTSATAENNRTLGTLLGQWLTYHARRRK